MSGKLGIRYGWNATLGSTYCLQEGEQMKDEIHSPHSTMLDGYPRKLFNALFAVTAGTVPGANPILTLPVN